MAEVKKIATRDSYGNALKELAREHDNIVVLDADLAEATKTIGFAKKYPERFFLYSFFSSFIQNIEFVPDSNYEKYFRSFKRRNYWRIKRQTKRIHK